MQGIFPGVPKKGILHACVSAAQPANNSNESCRNCTSDENKHYMVPLMRGCYCIKQRRCGRETGLVELQLRRMPKTETR